MNRLWLAAGLLVISNHSMAGFIHPMDFDGSEAQKQEVIEYIKAKVRKDYCDSGIDMCQNSTLRMMESENLSAFKQATKVTNREVMDRVIKDYCESGIDMCNYQNLLMMYNENEKAGKEQLSW